MEFLSKRVLDLDSLDELVEGFPLSFPGEQCVSGWYQLLVGDLLCLHSSRQVDEKLTILPADRSEQSPTASRKGQRQ